MDLPLALAVPAFVLAAGLVWWAGTRLPRFVLALSDRTGLGQGFAGMLVLGGITSLPELATATSAAALGAPLLALNNILGSVSFNILLLAAADMVLGAQPLTSVVARPVTLIQGVLGMILLAVLAAMVALAGQEAPSYAGLFSVVMFVLVLAALTISDRSERRPMWLVVNPPDLVLVDQPDHSRMAVSRIAYGLGGLALLILLGGVILAAAGEAIARQTGIGTGLFGFVFAAIATSLPELSAIVGAMRSKSYELAVGEVFGSNLFNLGIVLAIDLASPTTAVLALAGHFELVAILLALILSGIFVLGLIERRDRTVLRMGEDSITAIMVYLGGTALLLSLTG